jgi:hypothetical protein
MAWDVVGETLAESEYGAWNALVTASPGGSVYSVPAYLQALCTAAGGRFRIVAVKRGAELVGGVALYERDSRAGTFVSPRLLLYYNGIVVRRYETQYPSENTSRHVKILTALEATIGEAGYGSVNLRSRAVHDVRPFLARGWTAQPSYSYVVDLDIDSAWGRIEQNLRRLIDRSGTEGLSFTDDDDFEAFFHLHATTLERHGAPVYLPHDAFRGFVATLQKQSLARLYHARTADGRSVAAQLVLLGPHAVSHTVSAGADPEFNRMGASAFLRWRSLQALAALGYKANDLTDATLNPVTHFKSQFGGTLELSLVLQSPQSTRYQWGEKLANARASARASAGSVVRKVLRLEQGDE